MSEAKLPLPYRDSCAHLLIPLNKCRHKTWYAPWKCVVSLDEGRLHKQELTIPQDERHGYEKCQYDEFMERVAKMDQVREAKGGARSN